MHSDSTSSLPQEKQPARSKKILSRHRSCKPGMECPPSLSHDNYLDGYLSSLSTAFIRLTQSGHCQTVADGDTKQVQLVGIDIPPFYIQGSLYR
ncbi:hypothetical protein [Pajaroellobacter abortibovis]|uniref:hypothetical protein n=1 Tax=Pajaroellobacter abortibovis TaxID=1882918 RepID=UPI0012EC91B2|nr:hypothetical protein [Pajaroellobacter abortibovis]